MRSAWTCVWCIVVVVVCWVVDFFGADDVEFGVLHVVDDECGEREEQIVMDEDGEY